MSPTLMVISMVSVAEQRGFFLGGPSLTPWKSTTPNSPFTTLCQFLQGRYGWMSQEFSILYGMVGLHVPNCELFAGRSRYRERASRPRLAPYEPPAHRVGGSSTLSRAVPSLQQRTAKTPPIFDAVPLQRQDRTWLFRQSIGQAPPGQQTPPRSVERDGCGRRRGLSFTSALALTPPDFCFG